MKPLSPFLLRRLGPGVLLMGVISAVILPRDNTAYQAIDVIAKVSEEARIPLVIDAVEFLDHGAVAAIGVGYYRSSLVAAEKLVRVLLGESPATIPMENVSEKKVTLNPAVAKRLGITFPSEVLKMQTSADEGVPLQAPLTKKWNIHLIELVEAPCIEESRQGVLAGLKEAGLVAERDYSLKLRNAQGEITMLNSLVDGALTDRADMIYTITTPALQMAMQKVQDRPVLFTLALDPLLVGDTGTHERHRPNVAGIYDRSPFKGMMPLLRQCVPQARTLGTLFAPGEVNAVNFKDELSKAAETAGYRVVALPASSASDVSSAALALTQRGVDVITQINDNLHSAAFPAIVSVAERAGLPVFAFTAPQAAQGAALVLANDQFDAGRESALIAAQVMRGANPADFPYRGVTKTRLLVDLAAARKAGITIPEAVQKRADTVLGQAAAAAGPAR